MKNKQTPIFNTAGLALLLLSLWCFVLGAGLGVYAKLSANLPYAILSSVAIGAAVLFGLLAALWWKAPRRGSD